jgi:hypothetical protein
VRYVRGESLQLEVQQEKKDLGLELKRIEEENKRLEEALKRRRDEEARRKALELDIGLDR